MPKIKILIKGYIEADTNGHTCSTITLVQDKNLNIIVDPGTTPNQKILTDKLKKLNLSPNDINIVFITHAHTDHYRNIGMFPNAKTLDYWGLWEADTLKKFKNPLTENIEVISTPGHSDDGMTLLVKTQKGTIAICGDVFWKENFPKNDPYVNDKKKLQESRKKITEIADYIIPGHGDIYKVNL